MIEEKQTAFPDNGWLRALSVYFGEKITQATKQTEELHGGTVASVFLVQGSALTSSKGEQPYQMIWKYTKKWDRPGDPLSWRREYDWVNQSKEISFHKDLRMPICYYMEMSDEGNHLWLEYITGTSGNHLSLSMLSETAYNWGVFQGKLSLSNVFLENKNITQPEFLEGELSQWYHNPYDYNYLCSEQCKIPSYVKDTLNNHDWNDGFSIVYHYLRSEECDLPVYLKQMIMKIDDSKEEIYERFSKLPKVITHRDFWIENIFYQDGIIYVLDWDCVGIGYLGEDIASLIADDTPTEEIDTWLMPLFSSYKKGFQAFGNALPIELKDVVLMILIKYGYRLVNHYWFTDSAEKKEDIIKRLTLYYHWLQKA